MFLVCRHTLPCSLVCCCRCFNLENQVNETAQHVEALATQPWPCKFASQNPHKRQMWQLTCVLPVRALLQQRGEQRSEQQKGDLASKTKKQGAVWGGNLLPKCCFLISRNRSLTFSFLFRFIFSALVFGLRACGVPRACLCRSWMRTSAPFAMVLQMIVSHQVNAGNWAWVLRKEQNKCPKPLCHLCSPT